MGLGLGARRRPAPARSPSARKHRTSAIQQSAARRQQRPQRVEQLRLDWQRAGPTSLGGAASARRAAVHNARGGAGGVEHDGVKGLAGGVRGKPVVWAAGIAQQHLGVQVQALQGVG